MTGPQGGAYADRGLIPRTLECLFQTLESATAADGDIDGVVTVRVSHLEIYVRPLPRVILGAFPFCALYLAASSSYACGVWVCVRVCVRGQWQNEQVFDLLAFQEDSPVDLGVFEDRRGTAVCWPPGDVHG